MSYNYSRSLRLAHDLLRRANMAEDYRVNIERFVRHMEARGASDQRKGSSFALAMENIMQT